MTADLQTENISLQQQLDRLLGEAQRNEEKMRRFDRLERRLIGADSLLELIGLVLSGYKQAFGIDFVSLALVDKDYEVARVVGGAGRELAPEGLRLFEAAELLEALYGEARDPWLGNFDARHHAWLFDCPPGTVASLALLPLVRQGELIGSLHFGSASAERYASGFGTDFLERLAAVVSICLESALARERLKQAGLTDQLTGVQNRRYFDHRCPVEISQARRYRHPLACMFLDVDRFKRINDVYGHPSGDEVLRSVASSIQAQLRAGDTVARYGGEEFVVLLPQSELHHACQIAERIRVTIERQAFYALTGQPIKVTVSIGVAMLPKELSGENDALAERLVATADKALYEAKHGGRNCVKSEAAPAGAAPLEKNGGSLFERMTEQLKRVF
jgi:diguanylate cyclase (GGDEF)-like protein